MYLHSQMLGVLQDFRRKGIGRTLKLAQRTAAIQRGFQKIEWTFDPFEIYNAQFNLEDLGAICRRYVTDAYGPSTSSLHGCLPTDRLVAEWHLESVRVRSRLDGGIHRRKNQTSTKSLLVNLPVSITEIRVEAPLQAAAIQRNFKQQVTDLFKKGYCVSGFESAFPSGNVSYHLIPFHPGVLSS